MKNSFNLKIKGVSYKFNLVDESFDNDGVSCCGLCKKVDKEIIVVNEDNLNEQIATILHELIHAYLWECGLSEESNDEKMVEWFSRQFVPIAKSLLFILDESGKVSCLKGRAKKYG